MAKLAIFVACEKVIVDQESHVVSLIGLFTTLKIALPPGEQPPSNAVAPKDWAIIGAWDPDEGEGNREFTQCVNVFLPSGKPFVENGKLVFKMNAEKRTHNTMKLNGFPIGEEGKCEIQIWLEADGKAITGRSSIYVSVEHERLAN